MPYLTEKVISLVELQNNSRPGWNSNKEFVAKRLLEEEEERKEERDKVILGADPIHYVGEIGDILYLAVELARNNDNLGAISLEVMKAYYSAIEEALEMGIDLNDALLMKLFRNDLKYPHMFSNNGFKDSSEVIHYSKEQWKLMNGEQMWSIAFMMLGEEITHH